MTWLLRGILRFGSPLLVLTVVACGGSGSRLLVLSPPTPAPSGRPALPDQVSQSNLDALVDSLPDRLFLRDTLEIPAQSFLFPAGLRSLTIIITDPDGEELVVVLTPELLGCNATGTVCNIPVTRLLLQGLKLGTYRLNFEAIDQNGIPYLAEKDIVALEQAEDIPSPAPFNPNPGPLPDPAGTPAPSPSPGASPTPTPEPTPTAEPGASPTPEPTPSADPGAEPVARFDSQPARRSTINVGSALIGQQTSTSLTIIEIGNAPLQVEASIIGGGASDFQIKPTTFLIPDGGANQVATITCTPSAVGSRAATLTLATNDPFHPTINYPLVCKGLAAPVAGFRSVPTSGSPIDLGSAIINTATGSQTLSISNTGTAKLEVGSAQLTGTNIDDFTIDPKTAFGIEVSGSQDVTITCTPGDLGERTATLEFTTNDPNNATVSYDLECEGLAAASLVVNTLDDEDGTNLNKCSLREAIEANNTDADFGGCADPEGTIGFETGLNGTITITNSALPQITEDTTINGPGSSTLAVSGDNQFRVFDIGSNLNVTIDQLTITQGSISGDGGGILAGTGTTLTVSNSTLSNNTASSQGGGIFATTATVSNSTLSGNSAGSYGGGIFASNTVTVTDSTFSSNSAEKEGGAISGETTTAEGVTERQKGSQGKGLQGYDEKG